METRHSHRWGFQCEPGILSRWIPTIPMGISFSQGYLDTFLSLSPKGTAIWYVEASVWSRYQVSSQRLALQMVDTEMLLCFVQFVPQSLNCGSERMKKWQTPYIYRKAEIRWSSLCGEKVEALRSSTYLLYKHGGRVVAFSWTRR